MSLFYLQGSAGFKALTKEDIELLKESNMQSKDYRRMDAEEELIRIPIPVNTGQKHPKETLEPSFPDIGLEMQMPYMQDPAPKKEGLRFNQGKLRYDLVPAYAQKEYVKVLTKGAEKYAERNWEKGMAWSKVYASLERHMAAIKNGEDVDSETGCLHSAHIMCNAAFLTEYYKTYPQGDDRPHSYLNTPKIGLDIDEVICDWVGAWCKKFGYPIPESWHFSYNNKDHFESFTPEELKEFYLSIPAKIPASEIPFEPHCYITSRSVPIEITKEWITKHGFPSAEVYSVPFGASKVEIAKSSGIDIFVDDRFDNFVELNNAGICTYLFDASHNRRYEVGYKRIKSLKELVTT